MPYNPLDDYEKIKSRLEQWMEKAKTKEERSLLERIASSVFRLKESALANPVTGYRGIRQRDYDAQQLVKNPRNLHTQFDMFIAMIDLDNFGRFNKEYSQSVGDKVLKATAEILEEGLRYYDIVAKGYHLHGEEFQVFLQAPSKELAALIIDRLRKDLAEKSKKKTGHTVTASIGLTRWGIMKGEKIEKAQERADHSMQEAKKMGRNRVLYTD
ncbi:GGDEF domain-containing protein [Candidatus Woesearchaeota archaeon]|nr:GGDEF domain-containing protein [Candidatus Woesearchaeota archaeon]